MNRKSIVAFITSVVLLLEILFFYPKIATEADMYVFLGLFLGTIFIGMVEINKKIN